MNVATYQGVECTICSDVFASIDGFVEHLTKTDLCPEEHTV